MTKEYTPKALRKPKPCTEKYTGTMYGIGEEHTPGEFGMWYGPNHSEKDMLEQIGQSENSCIIKFKDNPKHPECILISDVIWRWKEDKWISVE